MSFDPRAAMRRSIRHLRPYYKAPSEPLLRLDQNTNLAGRNPAIERVGLDALEFNQYPTRDADALLLAIERQHGLPEGSVLCGNGSDEALDIICKAFTEPGDRLATPGPSYSLYPFYAALHDLEHVQVPVRDDWSVDIDALLDTKAKVILVATPNNPTGRAVPRIELERLVKEASGVVVVDEAYIEYHDGASMLDHIGEAKNLIVMRTFSKAYALAGARLGWTAAHPETTSVLGLVKPPFNVNVITEALGVQALQERAFVDAGVALVKRERSRLAEALTGLGFEVVPSEANFLLTFPPEGAPDGPTLNERLRAAGIAARTFGQIPRLERAIRFTIGRPEDNDALLTVLPRLLEVDA